MQLSKEKQAVLIKASQKNLINFCNLVDLKYQVSWHHEVIANKLEEVLRNVLLKKKSRVILEIPPRHGKSEIATIKLPAWALGNYPDLQFIIASYSADLATDFGQKTRDLMQDSNYQIVFGTRLRADSKAKGKWLTGRGGSYTATGVGGSITGKGFNIGIIDDPFKNREEAESEVYREKVWNWYRSTFYTRQEGEGAIILILTRWHSDDLAGRLLEKQKQDEEAGLINYDKWEEIRFPAIAEEDEKYRRQGEPLWPQKFNLANLENIKNTLGVYEWSALYQQEPITSESQEFKEVYFKYFEEKDVEKKVFDINILVDPAIGKKKENCDTAIVGVAKEKQNPEWYVLDYIFGKLDPGQLIDATFTMFFELRRKYLNSNLNVFVEAVAYQQALMYFFKEEMKKRQEYFDINEYRDTSDKETRIRGLIPLYKTGVIFHRPWMKDLEKQALQFPKGKRVDILDALSFNLKAAKNTAKRSEYKQPEYQPLSDYEG